MTILNLAVCNLMNVSNFLKIQRLTLLSHTVRMISYIRPCSLHEKFYYNILKKIEKLLDYGTVKWGDTRRF